MGLGTWLLVLGNGLVVAKGCLVVGFLVLGSGWVVAKGGLVVGCWCMVVAC